MKSLLEKLKLSNSNWSNLIKKIEKDGVFLRLNTLHGTIGFSSTEDVFSILALRSLERNIIYEISKHDSTLLRSGLISDGALSQLGVKKFLAVTIVNAIVITLLLIKLDVETEFNSLINLSAPETLSGYFKLIFNKPIVSIFLALWNWNLWRGLMKSKTLMLNDIFTAIPFLKKILPDPH